MIKFAVTILTMLSVTTVVKGQTFIDQIRVGQKMPSEINKGGYVEENGDNCTCRIFTIRIRYNVNPRDLGGGGADLAETIGIHFNENDSVTGIINIKLRKNNEDAQKVYISRLSEYMRTQSYFKDRQLINVRDSNNGRVDGIYYFTYSLGGTKFKSTGVVEKAIIEETYLPNSSYKPRLIN